MEQSIAVSTIQAILGHSNIETTMIYARLEKQYIKSEMKDKLENKKTL